MSALAAVLGLVGSLAATGTSIWQGMTNYANQGKANLYSKFLNLVQIYREDNAVQRRVADLRRAGLSPVLAAGSPASSGAPIRPEPSQKNLDVQMGILNNAYQMALMKKTIDKTAAEEERIRQKTEIEKGMYPASLANTLQSALLKAKTGNVKDVEKMIKDLDLERYQITGQGQTAGHVGKSLADVLMYLAKFADRVNKSGGELGKNLDDLFKK